MRFNIYLYLELRTRWKSSFPDVLKSTSGRSPLPPPLPLPIFPGKRRKTNWAIEPLEFSICPKLTPELSRPPRFRLFPRISRFSFSFPNEEPKPNIHAFPSKRGKEGEEELTSLDSNSPRRKGVNLQFYRWNKFARVWGPPPPPRFREETRFNSSQAKLLRAHPFVSYVFVVFKGKKVTL